MFTLAKEEAIQKAIESVGSYDLVSYPQYVSGRVDVAAVSVLSYDDDNMIVSYFVVVWKNERGIHCKKEKAPRGGEACFGIRPVFKMEEGGEIADITIEKASMRIEKKWLH